MSLAFEYPPFIKFPVRVLDNVNYETSTLQSPLLRLSNEVLLMLLKDHLSAFDRACLALTCKTLARFLTSHKNLLNLPAEIVRDNQWYLLEDVKPLIDLKSRVPAWKESKWKRYDLRFSAYNHTARVFCLILTLHFKKEGYRMCVDCLKLVTTDKSFWETQHDELVRRWLKYADKGDPFVPEPEPEDHYEAWVEGKQSSICESSYFIWCPWCSTGVPPLDLVTPFPKEAERLLGITE